MKKMLPLAGCLAVPVLFVAPASASFSQLVVFGDSLSDVGNVANATSGLLPGPGYDPTRFSNGPLWTEYLADELGLARPTPSLAGGTSYAFGGATSGNGFIPPGIPEVGVQVSTYLTFGTVDPDALHVVWVGSNDVIEDETTVDATTYAINVAGHLQALYLGGARSFLVSNLPALGLLPEYDGRPETADAADAASAALNAALASALDGFETSRPDATLFRLDVAGLFEQLVTDPIAFGLTNVADPAIGLSGVDADQYLFWDQTHPTTAAHRLLGVEAAAVVPEPASLGLAALACLAAGGRRLRR